MIGFKRGRWRVRTPQGKLHKFLTEQEAIDFVSSLGLPEEKANGTKEENVEERLSTEESWSFGVQQTEENPEPSEEVAYSGSESWEQS